MKVGDKAEITKKITESDVSLFCDISGDYNRLHTEGRLVHGALTASLMSAVMGTKLPGPGTVLVTQNIHFKAPVYMGDTITAKVEIWKILPKNRIILCNSCRNQDGKQVIDGEAEVFFRGA